MGFLSCSLGMVACLSYLGSSITDEDVFVMRYLCQEIYELPDTTFLLNSPYRPGYANADELEKLGLKFRWKPDGKPVSEPRLASFRKGELTRACNEFESIADHRSNWTGK